MMRVTAVREGSGVIRLLGVAPQPKGARRSGRTLPESRTWMQRTGRIHALLGCWQTSRLEGLEDQFPRIFVARARLHRSVFFYAAIHLLATQTPQFSLYAGQATVAHTLQNFQKHPGSERRKAGVGVFL